ncbi:MAG TPA: hypothetical protein PKH31_07335 [Candidatus Sumerlaeota bacterium]|nr:hypothetical protein [Candidatus Sumerlaeota bacterium]
MRSRSGKRGMRCILAGLCALWMASGAWAADAPVLSDIVPGETLLYIETRDLKGLDEAWQKTPFAKMWDDPKFQAFLKPSKLKVQEARADFEKEIGMKCEQFKQVFEGEVAVFLGDVQLPGAGAPSGEPALSWGMLARVPKPERQQEVKRIIEEKVIGPSVPQNAERASNTFKGVTIHSVQFHKPVEPAPAKASATVTPTAVQTPATTQTQGTLVRYEYAFAGDVCLLTEGPRDFMKQALTNYFDAKEGKPAAGALTPTANYAKARGLLGEKQDVSVYANVERALSIFLKVPEMQMYRSQIAALGAQEFESLSLGGKFRPDGALVVNFLLTTKPQPKGLASLLVRESKNRQASLEMTPGNAIAYQSFEFDVANAYTQLRNIVTQAAPQFLPFVDLYENSLQQKTGVKISTDILSRIKGEIASCTLPAEKTGTAASSLADLFDTVYFVEFTGEAGDLPEKISKLVSAFLEGQTSVPKMETLPFEGTKIYTFKSDRLAGQAGASAGEATEFSFATVNSFLVFTPHAETLKSTVLRAKGQAKTPGLASREDYKRMCSQLKPGYSGVDWSDNKKAVNLALENSQVLEILKSLDLFDTTALPPAEDFARYLDQSIGAIYTGPDYFRYQSLTTSPK